MPVHPPANHATIQDGHAEFGVPIPTIRLALREGRLPGVKVHGRVYVDRDALAEFARPKPVMGARAQLDAAIDRLVNNAPALTDTQRQRLAGVFGGAA